MEASVLIPDPSSFILNPSLASEQASVGALAAAPTKNTPLSVTLIWNFTTSDYEQISNEPSYAAYITSNCTVKDIYTVTSSTGTYNLQFFESAYQGSVLAFYLNANIHGRNVFFGMSTVRAMNVSQPPVNSTASLTEPLQVSLTWASPIVGVESDRRLPSLQTEMDRRSGGRVRQTDRQDESDIMIQKQKQNKIQCKTFFFSRALFPKTAVHPEAESSRSQCRDRRRYRLRLGSRKAPDRRGSQPGWSGPPQGGQGRGHRARIA